MKKYNRRDEKMERKNDNKKVNFPLGKITLTLAALGVMGGVFFAAFLSQQTQVESVTAQQEIVVSDSLQENLTVEDESNKEVVIIEETTTTYPEDADSKKEVVVEEVKSETPKAEQTTKNDSTKATITPAPVETATPKLTPKPTPKPTEPATTYPSNYCPDTREEDPAAYDSCREGFVAPTIQWAGYHSCKKLSTGDIKIFGKIELVGGNYNGFSCGTASEKSYGIVSSINSSAPYMVNWYAKVSFSSMDSQRTGIIERVYGDGLEIIDESLLPTSCRF